MGVSQIRTRKKIRTRACSCTGGGGYVFLERRHCTPPRFSLRSWEQLSKLLVTFYPGVPLYGTHIDLKNAFWSFVLLESARTVFRLQSGPSGRVVGLGRLPFGWKYSPFICQQTLARIVERVLPPDILLLHYLDDFLLVHHDNNDNTGNTVIALGREGFIVSPKSVLEPATQLVFLGKWLDPLVRMVWSHEVAHLQMFVAWLRLAVWRSESRLLQSFLGFLHWQVRPRGVACPFAAGAYCWLREEGLGHTLVAVLDSLVVLQTVAAELWRAPVARVQTMCMELGLQRATPVLLGRWREGPGLVLFVDGAHDGPSWRMRGFWEFLGIRSYVARRLRAQSQQLVELHSLAWGVRLAVALGYTTVTLVSDSEVAIAQFLQVRAKSVLGAQQSVLRGLARRLVCSGLVVRVLCVPCGFQPADPMSRLQGEFGGDRVQAERETWLVYEQLLCCLDKVEFRGVLCWGKGTESGVV